MSIRFEWDPSKEAANLKKHKIDFETAMAVFDDPFAITKHDRIEDGEYRWQTLGITGDLIILMVAHTWKEDEDGTEVVRIISARKADRKERKRYEKAYAQD
jgi:uncharacterized DUF497 family protein